MKCDGAHECIVGRRVTTVKRDDREWCVVNGVRPSLAYFEIDLVKTETACSMAAGIDARGISIDPEEVTPNPLFLEPPTENQSQVRIATVEVDNSNDSIGRQRVHSGDEQGNEMDDLLQLATTIS